MRIAAAGAPRYRKHRPTGERQMMRMLRWTMAAAMALPMIATAYADDMKVATAGPISSTPTSEPTDIA